MKHLAGISLLLLCALACAHHRPEPYRPPRPGPEWKAPDRIPAPEPFPERTLLAPREETPPRTLGRVDQILGQIGEIKLPEPAWRRVPLNAEIAAIQKELDTLGISTGALLRQRLGKPRPEEEAAFRGAAGLYLRWGLALMRTGEVNQRIWGADKIRQAMAWDPEDPIPLLVLAGYMELAGFWSNELELLEGYIKDHGHSDLVDLQLLRARERAWKVTRTRDELEAACGVCSGMADTKGGWEAAPGWLALEHARLCYEADSTDRAESEALRALHDSEVDRDALTPDSHTDPDTLTTAQAELLLGVLGVRNLEFEAADQHLRRAMALAAACPPLAGLASWMSIPWDLWTGDQRSAFDRSSEQKNFIDRFWHAGDPVLATPALDENLVEYRRRVGEAWFSLSGVDPGTPGPMTDAGQVMLRFGFPLQWTSTGGEATSGLSAGGGWDFGINRSWRFTYRLQGPSRGPVTILFQDRGSSSRFTATDSLRGPQYPPCVFDDLLGGKDYRLSTAIARFREPDGHPRLVLSYDTYLPDYTVRFPMQGLRFEGEARVHSTLLRMGRGQTWRPGPQVEVILNRESVVNSEREFRRRSGIMTLHSLKPETVRLASVLTLRDSGGRIVAMAVDNGQSGQLRGFDTHDLDASDLLLFSAPEDSTPEDTQRTLAPGLVAYGPDLDAMKIIPRAGRTFLPGEDFAFYFEVYNIQADGPAAVDLATSLQRLREDGTFEYGISLRGGIGMKLSHVTQWNVTRAVRLGALEPGPYRLLVSAFDHRAGMQVTRAAEFTVVEPKDLVSLYKWENLAPPREGKQ